MSEKKSSYSKIIDEIRKKIQNTTAETNEGAEKLNEIYKVLNESKTPILDLKPFITGAEKIAGDDVALTDVIKFCRNKFKVDNGSFDFILNLAKEEHFKELTRLGHPSPNSTVREFKKYLEGDADDTEIEEAIKNGVFDSMKSSILKEIKSVLDYETPRIDTLNESVVDSFLMPRLVKYTPIGIQVEDEKTQKMVLLTESSSIQFDGKNFTPIEKSSLNIDSQSRKIMNAITSLKYDAIERVFSLNESCWDFTAKIDTNGIFKLGDKEVSPEHVEKLLFESVKVYESNPIKYPNFNKKKALHEIDNVKCLMENAHTLISFDPLTCVKNLNENAYVIFDNRNNEVPNILTSSLNESSKLFESFASLKKECDSILKLETKLFESQINNESLKFAERQKHIDLLIEEQKELNESIKNIQNVKKIADENSPAMVRLNEQESELNILLNANLTNLNELKNNFKLY